jgi:hypothetical protein
VTGRLVAVRFMTGAARPRMTGITGAEIFFSRARVCVRARARASLQRNADLQPKQRKKKLSHYRP